MTRANPHIPSRAPAFRYLVALLPALLAARSSGAPVHWWRDWEPYRVVTIECDKPQGPIARYGLGFNSLAAQARNRSGVPDPMPWPPDVSPLRPALVRGSYGMLREQMGFERWRAEAIANHVAPVFVQELGTIWVKELENKGVPPASPVSSEGSKADWKALVESWLNGELAGFAAKLHDDIVSGAIPPPAANAQGEINLGELLRLDLWNEPETYFTLANGKGDAASFFGNEARNPYFDDFYATWVYTFRIIDAYRARVPAALNWPLWGGKRFVFKPRISGPSNSGYNASTLKRFLELAAVDGVVPDDLNWHALSVTSMRSTEGDIGDMRTRLLGLAAKMTVNEWVPCDGCTGYAQTLQSSPAVNFRYLAILERQRVLGARSCHGEPDGTGTCDNLSLDGLLDPLQARRSVWWAFQMFSGLGGQRLQVRNAGPGTDFLAGYEAGAGWVLGGRYDSGTRPIRIALQHLPPETILRDSVSIAFSVLANSGFGPSNGPVQEYAALKFPVHHGQAVIPVPESRLGDLFLLRFQKP